MLQNKPRGVSRVDDRRILNGMLWVLRPGAPWRDLPERALVLIPSATTASFVGAGLVFGIRSWTPSPVLMTRRCT